MTRLCLRAGLAALLLFFTAPALAMFEETESGVRPAGMGSAFTAVADDVTALDFNPAGLYQVEQYQFAGFGKLLYGGVDVGLHTVQGALAVPVRGAGVFAVRLQESGYSLESQRSLKLGHGIKLADGLAVGYGLNGYNLFQKDFGQGYAFGLDVGMFGRIYRMWTVGFYAHNLNMPKIGGSDLPRLLAVGLGFTPTPGIQSALDLAKEPGQPTRVSVGQEFTIVEDYLVVRAGVSTEPVRLGFGLRTGLKQFHVDYALQTHAELPWTHNLGITAEF